MPSTRSKPKQPLPKANGIHLLSELRDIHKGQVGVIIGNGWSVQFYDTTKMKADGCVLFGCNRGYKLHPLDYLMWQDSECRVDCRSFKGTKICLFKESKVSGFDPETTYFFQTGKLSVQENSPCRIRLMNTGGMSLQAAIVLGCDPIILVGCDCRMFTGFATERRYHGFRSNMFQDKQAHLASNNAKKLVYVDGIPTTSNMQVFAKRFSEIYQANKDNVSIFQMGEWSIIKDIPTVEWSEYWTDKHPGRSIAHNAEPEKGD